MAARIDDPDLDVTRDSVLVLQNAGPSGAPGMPEWGQLPIPKKLLRAGRARHGAHLRRAHERHQLRRLRAARLAGILRRRAAGAGARRRLIELDVPRRKLNLAISDEEMARRRAAWTPPPPHYQRSYGALFAAHIGQAETGCDFDFLASHLPVKEPEIH